MQKAWNLGADRYWLLNVGDIKPGELGIQLFMDMAWDFEKFTFDNVNHHSVDFLCDIFGEKYRNDIEYILQKYYYLGFLRKPEYMTWDWRWNSLFAKTNIKDTEFSFINYDEAESRLRDYRKNSDLSDNIMKELDNDYRPAFFELLYYPVKASSIYNHEMLIAKKTDGMHRKAGI